MAEKYIMINDIIEEHNARMQNLKKYYPYFSLVQNTFSQYKEGKYEELDMGYITMASLRFFINENSFNEQEITYEQYERFLREILTRDFLLKVSEDEEKELIGYIFDKLKNDGKAFEFQFFDPQDKKRKISRVKLIEGQIRDNIIFYHITSEGIEFYLDTKEIKDESKISIQQVLLGKMIAAKNFKGGIEVVRRINSEVNKLVLKKNEVISTLNYDVFQGSRDYEEYMSTVAKWFSEEQKLFTKNKELIEQALNKASIEGKAQEEKTLFYKSLEEINRLETEFKKTINRHSELINETIDLQKISDQIISRAKLRKLRLVFDFKENLHKLEKNDNVEGMGIILAPFFAPNIRKSFPISSIDNLLTYKTDDSLKGEIIKKEKVIENFKYEDELEDERISKNYGRMLYELLDQLDRKKKIDLKEFNGILEIKFGEDIYQNGDYYSFMVHLSQKKEYSIKSIINRQDTFLEGIAISQLTYEEKERFMNMSFRLTSISEEEIILGENISISNIVFERTEA